LKECLRCLINSALVFAGIVATFFQVLEWFLALKFVEEAQLSAGDVLHLFPEAADSIELADCGDEGILVPGMASARPIKFPPANCPMNLAASSGWAAFFVAESVPFQIS
jgi:hypothetical protein